MKKALSLILALALCLSLCACGNSQDANQTQPATTTTEATNSTADAINKLSLEEKASTDRAEFTLLKSELTYYVHYTGEADTVLTSATEAGDTYAASLGDCFVLLTFAITNKDRTAIGYGGPMPEWDPKWSVSYKGQDYPVNGFNVMEGFSYIDLQYSVITSQDGTAIEINKYANHTIDAGETVYMRALGVIDVDPENLTDGYDFTVGIINTAGEYEYFTYFIPAQQ